MSTYYASPTGSSINPGTRALPWKLGDSNTPGPLTNLVDGDEVVFLPGDYKAPIILPERVGATAYVTLRAETPRTVTIFTTSQYAGINTTTVGANWIRISGIDFKNHYTAVEQNGPLAHFEMLDCQITGGVRGIKLYGPGEDWTFRNVVHNGVPTGMILGVKGSVEYIEGVLVEDCQSIDCDHAELTNTDGFVMEENVHDVIIRDCLSHGSEDTGFDIKASPLLIERCEAYDSNGGFKIWGVGAVLKNCYAHDCGDYGITLANDDMRLEWCTFTRNARCAIRSQGYDNQTHVYLGCVFDSPVGMPPLRNGYNDTYPQTSYCWWRKGSSAVDVLWYLETLWIRYRAAAQYVSDSDVIDETGVVPLNETTGDITPGSIPETMGPNNEKIGWLGTIPVGEITIVPPNSANPPPATGTDTGTGSGTTTPPIPGTSDIINDISLVKYNLYYLLRELELGYTIILGEEEPAKVSGNTIFLYETDILNSPLQLGVGIKRTIGFIVVVFSANGIIHDNVVSNILDRCYNSGNEIYDYSSVNGVSNFPYSPADGATANAAYQIINYGWMDFISAEATKVLEEELDRVIYARTIIELVVSYAKE